MPDMTPQERLALVVIALLLMAGAGVRHLSTRAESRQWLEYSAETADTLDPARSSVLLDRAEEELRDAHVRSTPLRDGEKLDPNEVGAEQLDRLPRVGAALADRIVAHRRENGPFRSVADLGAVPGIGPAVLEGIAPFIALPATAVVSRGPSRGLRLDINTATAAELEALPGVGPALAARILADRERNGRFRTYEDLERVSGIGPRLRERLQAEIRLGN